jgi:hypothetical protein
MRSFITFLLPKYNLNDEVKDEGVSRTCSTKRGRIGLQIGYWWESQKERDY